MNNVKYLGTYEGPSYGSGGWNETMDAFGSLKGAMEAMLNREHYKSDNVVTYKENPDGYYVYWTEERTHFPATTDQDYMDLYYAVPDHTYPGAYLQGDWAYRITVGPRGGIRAEKA